MHTDYFCGPLFGGDQLTVARAIGAQRIRSNSDGAGCLEGLIPVVEDWHANVCLLGVRVPCIQYVMQYDISAEISHAGDLEKIVS